MNKTYKEIFQEERVLSTALAKHWGYNIKNIGLDNKLKKESEDKPPIVANINTLKLIKDIPKTQKIIKIEDQLRAIENGRLLAKFTEEAAKKQSNLSKVLTQKSPIIILMEQKVKQYNHIITHKHLNKEFNEQTRKILKIEKDEQQIILQKIQEQEVKLNNATLKNQIQINKHLAQLYKSYRAKVEKNKSKGQKSPQKTTKTVISEPAKSGHNITKHDQIPKIQKVRNFSKQNSQRKAANSRSDRALLINIQSVQNNLRRTQARQNSLHYSTNYSYLYKYDDNKGNITDRTSNRRQGPHQQERILKTIYSPFQQKQKLEQYAKIEKNNDNNFTTLDMFKTKISQFKIKNIVNHREKKIKIKKSSNHLHSIETKPLTIKQEDQSSIAMNDEEKVVYESIVAQNQQKYNQQRSIFAELLKKKHNKYNRVGLSRVLVKYDEQKQAKQLLKGDLSKKNNQNIPQIPINQFSDQKALSNKKRIISSLNNELSDVFYNESDDQHYERMCKNEKINLLLKHK